MKSFGAKWEDATDPDAGAYLERKTEDRITRTGSFRLYDVLVRAVQRHIIRAMID